MLSTTWAAKAKSKYEVYPSAYANLYATGVCKNYEEILSMGTSGATWQPPNRTVSEAVGYKITKRKMIQSEDGTYSAGDIIQTVYIGNTPETGENADGSERRQRCARATAPQRAQRPPRGLQALPWIQHQPIAAA